MAVLTPAFPTEELSSERAIGTSLKRTDFMVSFGFAFIYIRALNLENETQSLKLQQAAFLVINCSLKSQLATIQD